VHQFVGPFLLQDEGKVILLIKENSDILGEKENREYKK